MQVRHRDPGQQRWHGQHEHAHRDAQQTTPGGRRVGGADRQHGGERHGEGDQQTTGHRERWSVQCGPGDHEGVVRAERLGGERDGGDQPQAQRRDQPALPYRDAAGQRVAPLHGGRPSTVVLGRRAGAAQREQPGGHRGGVPGEQQPESERGVQRGERRRPHQLGAAGQPGVHGDLQVGHGPPGSEQRERGQHPGGDARPATQQERAGRHGR